MTENQLAQVVVNKAYEIHAGLGPGLFESVYHAVLLQELRAAQIAVETQVPVPVVWKEAKLEIGFIADLILEGKLIVELKSVEKLSQVHMKQLTTYLKLTGCRLGLLINFGDALIRGNIKRIVNGLRDDEP